MDTRAYMFVCVRVCVRVEDVLCGGEDKVKRGVPLASQQCECNMHVHQTINKGGSACRTCKSQASIQKYFKEVGQLRFQGELFKKH